LTSWNLKVCCVKNIGIQVILCQLYSCSNEHCCFHLRTTKQQKMCLELLTYIVLTEVGWCASSGFHFLCLTWILCFLMGQTLSTWCGFQACHVDITVVRPEFLYYVEIEENSGRHPCTLHHYVVTKLWYWWLIGVQFLAGRVCNFSLLYSMQTDCWVWLTS